MNFAQVGDAVEIPASQRTNDECGNHDCGVRNLGERHVVVQRGGVSFCSFPCAGVAYPMPFNGYMRIPITQAGSA